MLVLAADPTSPACLASGGEDGTVCLWDRRAGTAAVHRLAELFEGQPIPALCYGTGASEQELFAAAGKTIRRIDLRLLGEGVATGLGDGCSRTDGVIAV